MELKLYDSQLDTRIEEQRFLSLVKGYFNSKQYSSCLNYLNVLPIIVSDAEKAEGKGGENYHYSKMCCAAWMAREINYNIYINASLEERKSLLVKNILICMKLLEKKAKLDYPAFEKDMLEFCRQNNIVVDISDISDIVKASKPKKPKRNKDELYWTIKISDGKQGYDDNQNGYAIIDDYFTMLEMQDTNYIKLIPSIPLNDISYLKAYLDKTKDYVIIEAHNINSVYVMKEQTIGEALEIYVNFYKNHKLDLKNWRKQ